MVYIIDIYPCYKKSSQGLGMGTGKPDTAKIFTTGRSQAVRLPKAYRFADKEVNIHKDPLTGDVILSERANGWDRLLSSLKQLDIPEDFPGKRGQDGHIRDPLDGYKQE